MRIKDWNKFQHYPHRHPIWIKLYMDLLDDLEWHKLDPLAAKTLVNLWMIGSEKKGVLPQMEELAFRLRTTESEVKSCICKLGHWLEQDDSNPLSTCDDSAITDKIRLEEIRIDKARSVSVNPVAVKIYDFYAGNISNIPAKRSDAIRNITKLLKNGITEDSLVGAVDDYANSNPGDKPYHANNFFGQKEYYRGYGIFREGTE